MIGVMQPTRRRLLSRRNAIALLAAPLAVTPVPLRAQTNVIRFASSPSADSYQLPYYAVELGFFRRAGLNVEMASFANAGTVATAVAGGAVDVAHADPIVVANAFNRGVPWAFFAGGGCYSTEAATTVLCAAQNGTIRTAKDLEGKAVGVVALASISALGVKSWIESNGADLSKVKFYELPYTTMVPGLNRGDLAAAFIAEPFFSQLKKDVRVLANAYDAIARTFLIAATFSTRAWLSQNAATARRITQVLDDTVKWANTHHDESAIVTAKSTGLSLDAVHAMTRVRYAELDPKLIQPVLDAALKYKGIERAVNAADIIAK
jgi:ABC-type nitrate/sulfonate/bicarbonate transport system substrate-binding protein